MNDNLKTCSNCGKQIKADAEFCVFCGTKWTEPEKQSTILSGAVLCVSCGNSIPAGSAFCSICGANQSKRDSGMSAKKQHNKKTIIAASIAAAMVCIVIFGIIISGINNNPKSTHVADSQENKEMSTVKPSKETGTDTYAGIEGTDEKINDVSDSGTTAAFTYTNSQGESLEAEPGYSYVCCTKSMQSTIPHDANVLIPPVFDYTGDEFVMGTETGTNGFYTLSFKNEKLVDFGFVEDYVKDLEKYGFTLESTFNISDDHKVYYLNYSGSGNITHGAAEHYDGTYDMSIMSYKQYGTTSVIFTYPKEVWFDLEKAEGSYTAVKVSTDCSLSEKIEFKIRGWSQNSSDYIFLSFDSDTYGTGKVITASDFKTQAGAGKSALCNVAIWGSTISGDSSGWPVYVDSLDSIDVNVLQCDDSCIAISYSISVPSGSARYLLEGICVADVGEASAAGEGANGEPEQIYSGTEKCLTCNGTGQQKCGQCFGKGTQDCPKCSYGRIQCSLCHGTGRTSGSYGTTSNTCTRCHGTGYTNCTNCNGGYVFCSGCHGS